jgi:hypothetical protein
MEHLKQATKNVMAWPEWKKECAGVSELFVTAGYVPSIEECLDVISQLAKATRAQATATQEESMIVKMARKRAEKFLYDVGVKKTVDDKLVKERVVEILREWRTTNILSAGNFQSFLLAELDK